ncbi:MAG: GNAT family N-acetyltransferase [Actinobacteria bacterium]|nr:GNAT family N-acetyltransferase [Actinomycetota bacterium]
MKIIDAKPEQADELTKIATAAKSFWGYPKHWTELWHDELTVTDSYIRKNNVRIAVRDGELVGFYALEDKGEWWDLGHMWVWPGAIRSGVGRVLFQDAIGQVKRSGKKGIIILSDPKAEGFYKKMGAEQVGEYVTWLEGKRRALPILKIVVKDNQDE